MTIDPHTNPEQQAFNVARAQFEKNRALCANGDFLPATIVHVGDDGRVSLSDVKSSPAHLAAALRYDLPHAVVRRRVVALAVVVPVTFTCEDSALHASGSVTAFRSRTNSPPNFYEVPECDDALVSEPFRLVSGLREYLGLADSLVADRGMEDSLAELFPDDFLDAIAGHEFRAELGNEVLPWRVNQAFALQPASGKLRTSILRALESERQAVKQAVADLEDVLV